VAPAAPKEKLKHWRLMFPGQTRLNIAPEQRHSSSSFRFSLSKLAFFGQNAPQNDIHQYRQTKTHTADHKSGLNTTFVQPIIVG
jgi:hypothetical protein